MDCGTRVVFISGGSRGLGQRLVEHFLSREDNVATFARHPTPFIEQMLERRKGFSFEQLDAANTDGLMGYVDAVAQRWGRIDVLVNNAAIAHQGVLALVPDAEIEKVVEVNITSVLRLTRDCVRVMLRGHGGRIINIASIVAERGFSGLSTYSTTKAAMVGFTKSLARELGPRSITVNAVAPGFLDTDMTSTMPAKQREQIVRRTALGRLGTCEDVVPLVGFLASEAAGFITGQVITVDGGCSC